MKKSYAAVIMPVLSMLILTIGNSLFTTVTTLQLKALHTNNFFVGLVAGTFFLGLMVGPYLSQKFIIRVGHIRAYAVFAAVIATATLLQGLFTVPGAWLVLRFIVGYALAGLFIVIETWMLASSDATNKGRVMAFYLLSYYMAQSGGQLLLKIPFANELVPFSIIAGFAVLSILPVAMTRFTAPEMTEMQWVSPVRIYKKAPLGMWASCVSGLILGVIYGIYPLFLLESGIHHQQIATVMCVTILGGAILQLPIGKLSDQFDRRKVLFGLILLLAILSLYLAFVKETYWELLVVSFILGGLSFTIYPISISYTSDRTSATESVAAVSLLTLFYGLGSGIGPILVPVAMHIIGSAGFFMFLFVSAIILATYTLWCIMKRQGIQRKDKSDFMAAAPETATLTEDAVGEDS